MTFMPDKNEPMTLKMSGNVIKWHYQGISQNLPGILPGIYNATYYASIVNAI